MILIGTLTCLNTPSPSTQPSHSRAAHMLYGTTLGVHQHSANPYANVLFVHHTLEPTSTTHTALPTRTVQQKNWSLGGNPSASLRLHCQSDRPSAISSRLSSEIGCRYHLECGHQDSISLECRSQRDRNWPCEDGEPKKAVAAATSPMTSHMFQVIAALAVEALPTHTQDLTILLDQAMFIVSFTSRHPRCSPVPSLTLSSLPGK